jgi:hypothetical protein
MSTQSTIPACAEATPGAHSDIIIVGTLIHRIVTADLYLGTQGRRARTAPPGKDALVVFCIVPRAPVSAAKH